MKGAPRTVKASRKTARAKAPKKAVVPSKAASPAAPATVAKPAVPKLRLGPLREVKDALLKRRAFLMHNLGRLTAATEVSEKPVGDRADDASIDLEVDSAYSVVEQETEELRLIDVALEKIPNGTYGTCEECKKPIEKPRLKALPYAVLCLKCKRAEEVSRIETSEVNYGEIEEE